MQTQLTNHLLTLAKTYGEAANYAETTIGRFVASDPRFFSRIRDGKNFTVQKYDQVVAWFADNWPNRTLWPEGVPRPTEKV